MFKKNNYEKTRFQQGPNPMNDFMQQMPGMPGIQQIPGMPGMQPMPGMPQPQGGMLSSMQFERLQYDIMENRRRINNLAKRVARIESYLRIRDTPEYGYVEDEQKPSNYSY